MKLLIFHYFILLCLPIVNLQLLVKNQGLVQMCDSMIYCQGPILESVNYLQIFNDSKDYVDMPLVKSPNDTLNDFYATFPNISAITVESMKSFLATHFLQPGHELVPHQPSDWTALPSTFDVIKDKNYLAWAKNLNQIWLQLCKQVDSAILKNSDRYSIIYLPNPFVIPGGRFREYYYWDAYWIMKGLLVSEMFNTTKNMIRNYVELVNRFGFVPNGGRVYYLKRSQPPMLTSMVYSYYQATGDKEFLTEVLPTLEKELSFWFTNRATNVTLKNGNTYQVYQYNTPSTAPRPESYYQDVMNAKGFSDAEKPNFWSNIASTAESGWDFGSRWFKDQSIIQTVSTKRIVPVDLNAFICGNMKIISELYSNAGDLTKAATYQQQFNDFRDNFMKIFYNTTKGVWFDYNLDTNLHNVNFYPSTLIPIYTGCYYKTHPFERSLKYFVTSGSSNFPSGIPTSMTNTTQQWDFPNGWPPLNHMIIEGFRKSGVQPLVDIALDLAKRWLENNYAVYDQTSYMFEKYDVTEKGTAGGGGEYIVQVGFGWTNGVALDLLRTYGNLLKAPMPFTLSAAAPVSVSYIIRLPLLFALLFFLHLLYIRH